MKNVNVTPVAEATAIVSNAPSAVVKARGEAVAVSVQVDQINRVGHAANRVYGEQFATWAFQLAPSVKWHEMTVEQLKAANKELFAEAKAFRSEYVTSNISKVWSDIKGYAADFIKKDPTMCEVYYGVPELVELDAESDGGEGEGNAPRSADEVIRSSKKNGGVWLYRNLAKRDSLTGQQAHFLNDLRESLKYYGISEAELDGNA
jgi:hypothetical protein